MYEFYCRIFQLCLRLGACFLPWRSPEILEGKGCLSEIPALVKKKNLAPVLVVTDQGIASIGLAERLFEVLRKSGIPFRIYDKTLPNPTLDQVEEAKKIYTGGKCKGIVALGGGSAMDCAKALGARIARPGTALSKMKGLFRVLKKTPPLIAVPTTAGSGSETTLAAVISDNRTHEKYPVSDFVLFPDYAVLDPSLLLGLPPFITAITGMDALTHAVEAYIGRSNTKETKIDSLQAVRLIFGNLHDSFLHGNNLQARAKMQKAAFLAGRAFTRAYIGYVHAMAHTLGGLYATPHGLANAVLLPHVLQYYGPAVHRALAELADAAGIVGEKAGDSGKSMAFINAVRDLNRKMGIPEKLEGIRSEDIPLMVKRALDEANPLYPVPKILGKQDLFRLYKKISP